MVPMDETNRNKFFAEQARKKKNEVSGNRFDN